MRNKNLSFSKLGLISKTLDFVNFVDINSDYKNSFFLILDYKFSKSHVEEIKKLFKKYQINDCQYKIIPQLNLYSFPFMKTFFIQREKNTDVLHIEYDKNLSIKSSNFLYLVIKNIVSYFIYKLIRNINRSILKLQFRNKFFDTLFMDPHPYKLMHIDLIRFNEFNMFDGGRSTVSFNILPSFNGNLSSIIKFYINSKYKYLLSDSLQNKMINIKSKFYTSYNHNNLNNNYIIDIESNFDINSLKIDTNSVLVLSGNLPNSITKSILKNIVSYFPNKKIYYRPHPREKISKVFIKDLLDIELVNSVFSAEIDYFKLEHNLSSTIVHWNSSFITYLKKNKKINLINYTEIEKSFSNIP